LVLGTPDRFGCGKQVASYLGLIPCEDSSAERWRLVLHRWTAVTLPISTTMLVLKRLCTLRHGEPNVIR
jgi:hypothetical protein